MKRLYLTSYTVVPNEKGEEKVKKANKQEDGEHIQGSRAWYESLGVKPPKDLEEDKVEIDSEGYVSLNEDEVEVIGSVVIVKLNDFSMVIDDEEFTAVWLNNGTFVRVQESALEIDFQIDQLNKSFFQKTLSYIKNIWYICRNKFKNN